jgi:PilZ domain-containing protein
MPDSLANRLIRESEERRRSPRFGCSGLANFVCLPTEGGLLRGTIRNLSVGGCFIETGMVLPCGIRTEILARVHTSSFRALGQVKAVLGRAGVCIEFVRMSAGGEYLLNELVKNLAKVRTVSHLIGSAEQSEEPLDSNDVSFPCLGNFLPNQHTETQQTRLSTQRTIADVAPGIDPVDLFI